MTDYQHFHMSETSGASPGESPYLNRITWASYKALSRGQLGGIALGGLVGLGVGIAAAAAAAAILPMYGIPMGGGIVAATVLGATAIGAKYYYDVFKQVGSVSGAVAAGMEIAEERSQVMNMKLDTILNVMAKEGRISPEEIKTIEDDVETVYQKGNQHFEQKFAKPEHFFWSIGLVGAVAGVAILAAMGGVGYVASLFTEHAVPPIGTFLAQHMPQVVVATIGSALAGASYGINRNLYRNVLNVTNALFEGNMGEIEKQRAMQHGLAQHQALPDFTPVINNGNERVQAAPSPGTAVSDAQIDNQHSREVLAQRLAAATSWQEAQRQRAEEAALTEQQRIH